MLVAFQVASDVEENASQHFIANLRRALPQPDTLEGEDLGSVDQEVGKLDACAYGHFALICSLHTNAFEYTFTIYTARAHGTTL